MCGILQKKVYKTRITDLDPLTIWRMAAARTTWSSFVRFVLTFSHLLITLRRSCTIYTGYLTTASGVQTCWSGVRGTEQSSTRIPVAGLPACRRHRSARALVVTQLHLCERYHKHTVWRSCVRCRRTTTLEQSASRCPSDRLHSRNFLPEVEDV